METNGLTDEVYNNELTPEHWIAATIKDPLQRPPPGYMYCKYMSENLDKYLKWLDMQVEIKKPYAFTLTTNITDPEKFPEEEQRLITAVIKILSQNTNPVVDGEAYLEYTSNGAPHIHGWYRTEKGGRIYAKIFKRYWSLWDEDKRIGKGHYGGYHKKQESVEYTNYASAEGRLIFKV